MWIQILARLPSQLEFELRRPAPTRAPAGSSSAGDWLPLSCRKGSHCADHGEPTAQGEGWALRARGCEKDPASPSCSWPSPVGKAWLS